MTKRIVCLYEALLSDPPELHSWIYATEFKLTGSFRFSSLWITFFTLARSRSTINILFSLVSMTTSWQLSSIRLGLFVKQAQSRSLIYHHVSSKWRSRIVWFLWSWRRFNMILLILCIQCATNVLRNYKLIFKFTHLFVVYTSLNVFTFFT